MDRMGSTLHRTIATRTSLALSPQVRMSVMPAATENAVKQHHGEHQGMHKTVHGDGPIGGEFRTDSSFLHGDHRHKINFLLNRLKPTDVRIADRVPGHLAMRTGSRVILHAGRTEP